MNKSRIIKTLSIALLGSTIITTGIAPLEAHAAWKQNSTGWWYTEGNSWATGWRQLSGVWYYFDGNGYMKTGWVNDRGTWYYMDKSGAMKTGWINDNGTWYYLENSGAMKTGWLSYKGDWYFLKANGAMASDEFIFDKDKEYFLHRNGVMRTGWAPHGNYTCYLDLSTGEVVTGWREIDGKTYHFNALGKSLYGIWEKDGKEYFIGSEGYVMKNYTSSLITTDVNGVVTNLNADLAKEIILKNDSKYIEIKESQLGKIEFNNPLMVAPVEDLYSIYGEELSDYGIRTNEMFLQLYVQSEDKDELLKFNGCYLIGVESGRVFSVGEKSGMAIYEVKDNQIVNIFVKSDTTKWR